MCYPNPTNRDDFNRYIDENPAHRMSRARIQAESAWWAGWILQNGLIARQPKIKAVLRWQDGALALVGILVGLSGPAGYVSGLAGDVITAIGFMTTVWALFISARIRVARKGSAEAAERIEHRLAELVAYRRGMPAIPFN